MRSAEEVAVTVAVKTPGSRLRPGVCGGQGRGRTADLPLFRRTLVPTELPDRENPGTGQVPPAVPTGFEPATSTLTGWRALQACSTGPCVTSNPSRRFPHRDTSANRLRPGEHITGTPVVASIFPVSLVIRPDGPTRPLKFKITSHNERRVTHPPPEQVTCSSGPHDVQPAGSVRFVIGRPLGFDRHVNLLVDSFDETA